MLCDICHKNIATVHLTEIIDNKIVELHICQRCARAKADEIKQQLNISDFLSGLVEERKEHLKRCPQCGLSFQEFRKKGRLGCSMCYVAFKAELLPLLKKIHGSTHHNGKMPPKIEEKVLIDRKIRELRERLNRAIQLEEYEEAALLRDKLKEWEAKMKFIK